MNATHRVVFQSGPGELVALTERLITDVIDGDPNAGVVVAELLCHPLWYPVLCYLQSQGLVGDALWSRVRDSYGGDIWQFTADQILAMTGEEVTPPHLEKPCHSGAHSDIAPIDRLVADVMDGNPGTGMVIGELLRQPLGSLLLYYLRAQGLVGSTLWRAVKQGCSGDLPLFSRTQIGQILRQTLEREEGIW